MDISVAYGTRFPEYDSESGNVLTHSYAHVDSCCRKMKEDGGNMRGSPYEMGGLLIKTSEITSWPAYTCNYY
jgi:hypothetical protein